MALGEDLSGHILGKYELNDRIGRGGMAEVYKAYHRSLDRHVALKVLHPFLGEDPEFKQRFEREAQNIAKLRHENIIQVFDFDHDEGRDVFYMVMEFVDGPTLRNKLTQYDIRDEHAPVAESIRVSRALASALSYAHEHGMVHRDIKPANIMLDADDRVVLTDFGIAKIASGQQITSSGTMIGTPAYMSPEQGLGQAGDHRSDIYSLGVVMFQMAAGTPPYEADTPIGLVLKHVNDPLPVLKALNPGLPEGFEKIIYKSLAKSPDERLQSARQLYELLSNVEAAVQLALPANESTQRLVIPESLLTPSLEIGGSTIVDKAARSSTPGIGQISSNMIIGGVLVLVLIVGVLGIMLTRATSAIESISSSGDAQTQVAVVNEEPAIETPAPEVAVTQEPVEVTGTPDFEATALIATLDVIRAQQATEIAIGTPDLTATKVPPLVEPGCEYDFRLLSQEPDQGFSFVGGAEFTQSIEIRNTGDCEWEAGASLEFLDGLQLDGPEAIAIEQTVRPGGRVTVELDLAMNGTSETDSTPQSTWRLLTVDGKRIGRLLTFNYVALQPSATPTPTADS